MLDSEVCTSCGHALPDDAPMGLCPTCGLQSALDGESTFSGESANEALCNAIARQPFFGLRHGWIDPGSPDLTTDRSIGAMTDQGDATGTWTTDWDSDGAAESRGHDDPEVPGYEIRGRIGQGGMGVVYEALQCRANRRIALKMIRSDAEVRPEQLLRFQFEAQAVARLRHPNVVQIYEVGEVAGFPYFSLELLGGGTLKDRLSAARMPPREAAALIADLARAVAAAHHAGIIHRDLKPSNVLFDTDGTPKVVDFGLSKQLDSEDGQTMTGQVMGTPSYMSPEQAGGRNREVGPASDIYGLGAILYEVMAGRPPFKGTNATETLLMVLTEDPTPPSRLQPRLPRNLETICLKCLSKEPRRRYATADALAEDLGRYLAGKPILARPVSRAERAWKWARRHRVTAALAATGLVAAVILGGAAYRAELSSRRYTNQLKSVASKSIGQSDVLREKGQPDAARDPLVKLLTRIDGRPQLAEWRNLAERKLAEIDRVLNDKKAADDAQARLAEFGKLRDEASILDAQIAGSVPGLGEASIARTREAARSALGIFSATRPGGGLLPGPRPMKSRRIDGPKWSPIAIWSGWSCPRRSPGRSTAKIPASSSMRPWRCSIAPPLPTARLGPIWSVAPGCSNAEATEWARNEIESEPRPYPPRMLMTTSCLAWSNGGAANGRRHK